MKNVIKDALILFAITLIAGLLLAVVNQITAPKIEEANEVKKQEACNIVFEDAASFELSDSILESKDVVEYGEQNTKIKCNEVYIAYDNAGNELGYIFNISTKEGYGAEIKFMIGIRLDRTINAISILASSETVGLGLEADKVLVPQFAGKNVSEFTYTKLGSTAPEEIDAISSATITTKAFVNAVNNALGLFDVINEGRAN